MEIALNGMPPHKRWAYKLMSFSLIPSIYSIIAFGYIGIPENIQAMVRHQFPIEFRSYLISLMRLEDWFTLLFITALIGVIWGSFGGYVTGSLLKNTYKRIFQENELLQAKNSSNSIDCYNFFSQYIYNNYFTKFKLSANERVSLYKLDMDLFSCVGRYSDDELFKTKPDRFYPRDIGCIESVWKKGYFQHVTPHDPRVDLDAWNQHNINEFGFEQATLDRMKMKSQSLQGFRIKNDKQETVAVLIFESIEKTGLKFENIKGKMTTRELKNLCHMLESLDNHMPSLENAHSEGF